MGNYSKTKKRVILVATMDTKYEEACFLAEGLKGLGFDVEIADIGVMKASPSNIGINNTILFERGGAAFKPGVTEVRMDKFGPISEGLKKIVMARFEENLLDGIIALGGSGGITIAGPAFWALPFGVPKMMVTTVTSGNTRPFIKGKDIVLVNPVADLIGINRITRKVLTQAAHAFAGMVNVNETFHESQKRTAALTGFGATEPCVSACSELLKDAGFEVIVFHARGVSGGAVMEEMIDQGLIDAVLDITTTEIADEIAKGIFSAGNKRLEAAIKNRIPFVLVPGAVDIVNLGPLESVPEPFKTRRLLKHSAAATLMRTNHDEMIKIADYMLDKLKEAKGAYHIMIPERGFSSYDAQSKPFYDRQVDHDFIESMKKGTDTNHMSVHENHINDLDFAKKLVEQLLRLI